MPDQSGDKLEFIRNRSGAGGVNTQQFALDIEDNQAVEMTNIDASIDGLRKSRLGTTLVASGMTFGPPLAMAQFQGNGVASELLVVSPGGTYPSNDYLKLWGWAGNTTTWNLRGTLTGLTAATVGIQIVVGIDLNSISGSPYIARIFSEQAASRAFIWDGTNLNFTGSSGAAPVAGMFPACDMLNRGFASAPDPNRGKIYFTDPGSLGWTGWTTSQVVTMGGGSRQIVRNLKPFRGSDLVAFMADRIEVLQITSDSMDTAGPGGGSGPFTQWSRIVVDTTIGCAGHLCVASTGEDLLFADQFGNVRSLNRTITDNQQGVKSLPLSAPIQAYIDRINPAALRAINAHFHDQFCIFGLPLDSATDVSHSFVWDVVNKAWYGPWIGLFPAKVMASAALSAATLGKHQKTSLYLGAPTTTGGMVYRAFDGTTDAGAAILFQETSKRFNADQIETPKYFRRFVDFYQATGSESITEEVRKDGGAWQSLGTAISLVGDSPLLPLTFPFNFGGNGVVKKFFSLEQFGEQVQDLQFRMTATCLAQVSHLGFTLAFHRKNFPWKVD